MKFELTGRGVIYIALAIAGIILLRRLWPVVVLVVTAIIFMGALLPYVEWLVKRRVPRGLAVFLVAFTVFAAIVGLFAATVPGLLSEFQYIRDQLPDWTVTLQRWLHDVGVNVDLQERVRQINWAALLSGPAVDYTQQAVYALFATFTIIVMTVYLLVDAPRLARLIYQIAPADRRDDAATLLQSMRRVVGGYVRGQFITSAMIAGYTFAVLKVVGVPNALAFAVLAGIGDIIPLVGAYIAIGPQVAAASDVSTTSAIVVLVALLVYQQFEDRLLVPRVYGATLNLPPLVVLITVLVGAELLGVVGILLALPAAAAGRVLLEYILASRLLGLPTRITDPDDELFAPDDEDQSGERTSDHTPPGRQPV